MKKITIFIGLFQILYQTFKEHKVLGLFVAIALSFMFIYIGWYE